MQFVHHIQNVFEEHRNAERAEKMSAYLKDLFPSYGLMSQKRRDLTRLVYKDLGLPNNAVAVAKELFLQPERELHYVGQEMVLKAKKQWTEDTIYDLYWFVTNKSWWDTIDFFSANLLGEFFKRFPNTMEGTLLRWNTSDNFWVVRSTILTQLKYKKNTDTALLSTLILPHLAEKEFFIKKAIGWALREYAKVNSDWVMDFVSKHPLQPLSKREALKHIA